MDKRIVILTDFSNDALNAARYALDLYTGRKCTFYFLNTYHPDSYSDDSYDYSYSGLRNYTIKKPNTEEQFEDLMQVLGLYDKNPNHSYHTISAYNSLLEGVNDVIAKNDIDIIIMGAKGMTSSRTVVFGMNTINIMENIKACPVLAIPEDIEFMPPKEIVFPTDYKTPFKRRELKYLINIAQMHDADIRVLHVKESEKLNTNQQDNKELLDRLFIDVDHSFHELENITVLGGINAFIDSRHSDMVAFINQKRNFFSRMVSKPLVQELGNNLRVPVLVLRHRT
ncbi:universal stress protein [Flavobacteriaceae bacterium LMO-SS05]